MRPKTSCADEVHAYEARPPKVITRFLGQLECLLVPAPLVRVIVPGLLPIDFGWQQQRALRMPRLLKAVALATAGRVSHPADLRLVPHPVP